MKIFNRYKFSDKQQSLGGVIATIMGVVALLMLLYGVYVSFRMKGQAGIAVGNIALCSLLLSVVGCGIGLFSFREQDKFYTLSKFGSMLCGCMAVFMIAVLLMGLQHF
jgi:hypothetical protein